MHFTVEFGDNPNFPREYGPRGTEFAKRIKALFDQIASGGTDGDYVLVINGPDSICQMCTKSKRYKKKNCLCPDSFNGWDAGFLADMQRMDIREGYLYLFQDFAERVRNLYPDRNPGRR